MTLSDDMAVDPVPVEHIVNHRSTRFSETTQATSLSDITVSSLEGLRWMCRWLETVGEYSSRDLGQSAVQRELEALISDDNLNRVADCARNVTAVQKESVRVARVLHDLRGSALHQLVGLAGFWLSGQAIMGGLKAIAILASDHAKVLRHSLIGLDEERRLMDSGLRLHGIENLRRRFPLLVLYNSAGEVQVDFATVWNGDFAITCSEFSTVLKQLYNFMDNAARHTADQLVLMRIYPKPPVNPQSVRFVIANAITPAHRAKLSPGVLDALWGGYTTTGSGIGLVSSAALVAEAFGLEGPEQAVERGYVGSRITENGYVGWMHWPVVIGDAA